MNTETPFFILSAARAEYGAELNDARTATLKRTLQALGYPLALVRGCYAGVTEPAILVVDPAPGAPVCADDVLRLARQYQQESILAVDANRRARLIYCDDGRFESIGTWRGASEETARACVAWTERGGHYYIVT